jgi:hypothetical protein
MKRNEIINAIKELDRKNVCPYFYMVVLKGGKMIEDWLDRMEDKPLTNEEELIAEIEEFSQVRR